ncbi:hypothetical protein RHMOL_Rhmol02G0275700 [Rhododendron molle]|uniref:Uncharacterized protein n=1 Tax=Rhododendron molle TaxID=49168 RepID=A0ACC0PUX7_RHOML|nr:hypothetical protein RHMOL_Rhmol02G0275700 [Rhododendron molle]
MEPTLLFPSKRDQVRSKVRESVHIGLKDGGCPFGTVPIRRITKEDLIRERNVSKIRPLEEFVFGSHVSYPQPHCPVQFLSITFLLYSFTRMPLLDFFMLWFEQKLAQASTMELVRCLPYTVRGLIEVSTVPHDSRFKTQLRL